MRIHKSVKNIFLGITFLCIFLLPGAVEAKYDVKGDKSKTINNLDTGSYYAEVSTSFRGSVSTAYLDDPSKGDAINLYDDDEVNDGPINSSKFNGLKAKLEAGGSSAKNLSINNVSVINTKKGSIFVNKKSDGTEEILGLATSDDRMYVPKNPIPKDSADVDPESLDPKTGNGFLNLTDQDRGLEIGTTVSAKNYYHNAKQGMDKAQQKVDEATKKVNDAWKAQEDYRKSGGNDPAEIQRLSDAVKEAQKGVRDAAKEGGQANRDLQQAEAARQMTSQDYNATKCDTTWSVISSFYCITFTIAKFTNIIFKLMSFVTYIVGTLFDYSLELSINSAELFKKLGVVEITWSFLRDLLNITFIFILLWTSIQILLGNDAKYNAKKVLMNVVVVAILINFSLFAAKLMVDGSNIVSLKIYEAMKAGTAEKTASISERVMNTVGLTALYDINQIFAETTTFTKKGNACENNPGALITISVMGSIFLVILCLALGLAAVLFLIRLVNIIYLFIKSPLWVWGYVLPSSPTVTKFRTEWEAEMKHVLTFPIAYMFWMLVAIIVFEKLGKVSQGVNANGTKTTLLDLICSQPGTGGISQSISLVAIFAIVIIFMMQAIKYGVNNAGGSGNGVAGNFGKSVANKFGGWQDAMTKGIAKKTWDKTSGAAVAAGSLVAGAGIGTVKGGLTLASRTGMGVAKGFGGVGDKGFRKGFSEGFLNPGINAKEWLRDAARSRVANGGIVGELTGITSMAAKLANKYKDPVNMAGETKKQAEERRTNKSVEDEKLRYAAIDSHYKIDSQKDWLEKNSGKTVDDYDKYIDKILEQRTDAILGKGVSQKEGKPDKDGVIKGKHLDEIKAAAKKDFVDDKGNRQIKINEYAMHGALEDIIKYRSEGEGLKTGDLSNGKKRIETMRNRKAQARIKAGLGTAIKGSKTAAFSKKNEAEKTEDFNKKIKALQEKIKELPEVKDIDELIKTKTKYVGTSENENGIKDLNKAIDAYNRATSGSSSNPDIVARCERDIEAAKKKYAAHVESKKSALVKEEERFGNHLKAIDEKENKDKK